MFDNLCNLIPILSGQARPVCTIAFLWLVAQDSVVARLVALLGHLGYVWNPRVYFGTSVTQLLWVLVGSCKFTYANLLSFHYLNTVLYSHDLVQWLLLQLLYWLFCYYSSWLVNFCYNDAWVCFCRFTMVCLCMCMWQCMLCIYYILHTQTWIHSKCMDRKVKRNSLSFVLVSDNRSPLHYEKHFWIWYKQ